MKKNKMTSNGFLTDEKPFEISDLEFEVDATQSYKSADDLFENIMGDDGYEDVYKKDYAIS